MAVLIDYPDYVCLPNTTSEGPEEVSMAQVQDLSVTFTHKYRQLQDRIQARTLKVCKMGGHNKFQKSLINCNKLNSALRVDANVDVSSLYTNIPQDKGMKQSTELTSQIYHQTY